TRRRMSIDAEVSFDDLISSSSSTEPARATPMSSRADAPVPAGSPVNGEVTRASLRAQETARQEAAKKQASRPRKPVASKGEFYRPELHSGWDRFRKNLAVRIIGITVLVAGVVGIVLAAISRFA
ncbi:MAG: hypothetical protein Q7T71_16580, partial [Herbiconiux sp.]|nr:hypothetical protein [Herbiconiux sp.]